MCHVFRVLFAKEAVWSSFISSFHLSEQHELVDLPEAGGGSVSPRASVELQAGPAPSGGSGENPCPCRQLLGPAHTWAPGWVLQVPLPVALTPCPSDPGLLHAAECPWVVSGPSWGF